MWVIVPGCVKPLALREREALLFGRCPNTRLLTLDVKRELASFTVTPYRFDPGPGTYVSSDQLVLLHDAGGARAIATGSNPVSVQSWPETVRSLELAGGRGEDLGVLTTLWFDTTGSNRAAIGVVNPRAYHPRPHGAVAPGLHGTPRKSIPDPLSVGQVAAVADRFGRRLEFPARTPFPTLMRLSTATKTGLTGAGGRVGKLRPSKPLGTGVELLAALFETRLLFADDLFPYVPSLARLKPLLEGGRDAAA